MKLQLRDVNVSLTKKHILKDISFSLAQGRFLSVLGASGCGKSTLLKTIAGLLPCDNGEILFHEANVTHLPAHRRRTAIVFQDIRLFPHMNVMENIAFPLKMQGVPRHAREEAAKALLAQVQLDGYALRRPDQLSGGQQQRVALARALASKPDFLLLDEPLSSLDENLRFEMQLLLLQLHREYDLTTIMVTHNKKEALSMSDIILVMDQGCIIQTGSPKEVYEKPIDLIVARHFGNAVFVSGQVKGGIFHSPEFTVPCAMQDDAYVMMVRRDGLTLTRGSAFELVQRIDIGEEAELIARHMETQLLVRCAHHMQLPLTIGDTVDFIISEEKCRFFKKE